VLDSWDGMTKATLAIFVALFVQICVPYRGLIMYALHAWWKYFMALGGSLAWYQVAMLSVTLGGIGSYMLGRRLTIEDGEEQWKTLLGGFKIREATREDNEDLLKFSRSCGWGLRWQVRSEYQPHWAAHVLRIPEEASSGGDSPAIKTFIKVADAKNTDGTASAIVAVCTGALQPVMDRQGKLRVVGCIMELQVHETQRRRGIGSSLLATMERSLVSAGAEVVHTHMFFNQQGDQWATLVTANKYKPCSATKVYGWPTTGPPTERGMLGIAEKVDDMKEIETLWKEWFAQDKGLFPAQPLDLLNSPQNLGTWVARHKDAVASVTLWDTQSSLNYVTVKMGFRSTVTNIIMSLWSGFKLPTKPEVPLKARTLIGVYANGKRSKELFEGLMHDMHAKCHKDGINVLLVPLDYASTRQYALPYWETCSIDLVTAAKHYRRTAKGKMEAIDHEEEARLAAAEALAKGVVEEPVDPVKQAEKEDPIGYVLGFLDPRYMCM